MQFNVAQLLLEPTGSERRYTLTEDLNGLDPELRFLGPLVGELRLIRTPSGVLVVGELSTAVQVACNRCLAPMVAPVRFDIEELFHASTDVQTGRALRPEDYEGDIDDLDDEALLIDDKHILDISEVVRQDIWLAMPAYPVHENLADCVIDTRLPNLEDVRIVRAGERANRATDANHAASEDDMDPRWAALRRLQQSGEGEEQTDH